VKVHLLDSSEPLREGVNLTALCGAEVPKAHLLFRNDWERGECTPALDRACSKCMGAAMEPRAFRYTYGILSGEEALRYRIVPSEEA
jgi:hypothetical protein